MLEGLGQLLLRDRRTDKRACRQPARGAGKPVSFQWCAPALGKARRRAVAAPGLESRPRREAKEGRIYPRGLSRVPAWELSSSTPPGRTLVPEPRPRGLAGGAASPQPRALSAGPGDPRPPPHSSAALPPDFLLILARALETPGRPKCTQVCIAEWWRNDNALLETCTAPLLLFPRGAFPCTNSLRAL